MGKRDRRKPGAGPKLGAAASHAKPSAASHAPKQSAAGISKNQKRREKARAKEGLVAAPGAAATVAAAPPARGGTEPSTSGRPPALAYGSRSQGGRMRGAPSMLDKMRQKLQGGHFRWLNEQLYTTQGYEALDLMRGDPALYQQYHEGFRKQTEGWPEQPVDVAIEWLSRRPASWVVADLGCGDARVASAVEQQVHSFDLVAAAPGVVACNMARLPLSAASMDAALFCLSLMGTDYGSFVQEAARVLRPTGWLWVAEVQSRFVDEEGRSVVDAFVAAVGELGFVLKRKEMSNPYFLLLEFQGRKGRQTDGRGTPSWPTLRACQYKKR